MELQSGQSTINNAEELADLVSLIAAQKNRYFHRGGFSPYQLVFGANPRIPFELLGDDEMLDPVREDINADAFEQDSAVAAFHRSNQLRQKARDLCMRNSAKDKVQLSSSGPRRHLQRNWAVGQWVYVWRKHPGTGGGHITRGRWVGPGLVVMQSGHTVWVSMRARLWKCNSDQLRAASHHESLGAELSRAGELQEIVQQTRASRAGAIDITKEPSPEIEDLSEQVPPAEEVFPRVAQQEDLLGDLAPESEGTMANPGRGQPLRDVVSTPRRVNPATPRSMSRRSSLETVEEPLQEPPAQEQPEEPEPKIPRLGAEVPMSSTASSPRPATLNKAPRLENTETASASTAVLQPASRTPVIRGPRVHSQVSDWERARLEREAVKELRRLERLERSQSRGTPRIAAAGTPTPAMSSNNPGTPLPALPEVEEPNQDGSLDFSRCSELWLDPPGNAEFCFYASLSTKTEDDKVSLVAKPEKMRNNSEFNMKTASQEEKEGFNLADKAEWDAIANQLGAVKVHSGKDATEMRRKFSHRIISSRMIRRKKPMPGLNNFKYKSRWCVHGHKDPDSGSFQTFSPMPSVESITMFFQMCLNLDLQLTFGDIKNAFCQGDALDRPDGPILVSPCEGLDVEADTLIELVAPVYGLDDAPLRWHQTVVRFFEQIGFVRSLLEPCLMIRRVNGSVEAMVLIEVDDLNLAATELYMPQLKAALNDRFIFGKFEDDEADFAGRRVKKTADKITMHQEKYILEKVFTMKIAKGRASNKEASLEPEEFETYRSLLYKVNWLAHQTRPEAAGVVSILASRLKRPTIQDVCCLNKLVTHLRSTAQQCLTLHRFDNNKMIFIAASDAGGVDGVPPSTEVDGEALVDCTQGAWIVMASDQMPSANSKVKVSVLTWRSSKLRRRVSSTLGGEALAFSQALGELEWLQIMFHDIAFGNVNRSNWRKLYLHISPF